MNFKEFLDEAAETPDYDLIQKYAYFNNKLFKNKLPAIPMKWSNSRKMAGYVKVIIGTKKILGKTVVDSFKFKELALSKYYNRKEADYDGILVHEMIHVFLDSNGIHEGYDNVEMHGVEFMRKLNQLQRKVNFTINVTDTMPKSAVASGNVKDVGVILIKKNSKCIIGVVSVKTILTNPNIVSRTNWIGSDKWEAYNIGIVSNEIISEYPVQRAKVKLYELDTEKYVKLLKELKPLDSQPAIKPRTPRTPNKTSNKERTEWDDFFTDNREDLAQLGI